MHVCSRNRFLEEATYNQSMKYTIKNITICLCLALMLSGCSGGRSAFDQGYEDAWEGRDKNVFCSLSGEYKEGYDQGTYELNEFCNMQRIYDDNNHDLEETADELGLSVSEMKDKIEYYGIE